MYWFIRLLVLTDATSPRSAVEVNTDSLAQSLAVLDDAGDVVGGALNETRARRTVRRSAEPLADTVTSPDGFLSGKDSGSMLYVVRLA